MKWKLITKSYDKAFEILTQADQTLKELEKFICVYTIDDSNITYISKAIEFMDSYITSDVAKSFALYQVIE